MANDNQVVQFDAGALKQRVAESVQNTFGMLIPPDEWDQMVEREVRAFFEEEQKWAWEEKDTGTWSRQRLAELQLTVTPFRAQVWEEVRALVGKKIREIFDSDEFKSLTFGPIAESEPQLSEFLSKKLDELAPAMARALMGNLFAAAVDRAKEEVLKDIRNSV